MEVAERELLTVSVGKTWSSREELSRELTLLHNIFPRDQHAKAFFFQALKVTLTGTDSPTDFFFTTNKTRLQAAILERLSGLSGVLHSFGLIYSYTPMNQEDVQEFKTEFLAQKPNPAPSSPLERTVETPEISSSIVRGTPVLLFNLNDAWHSTLEELVEHFERECLRFAPRVWNDLRPEHRVIPFFTCVWLMGNQHASAFGSLDTEVDSSTPQKFAESSALTFQRFVQSHSLTYTQIRTLYWGVVLTVGQNIPEDILQQVNVEFVTRYKSGLTR